MNTFPLGTEQRSVLFLDRLLGPGILHNLTATLAVDPDVAPETVAAALVELGRRHPSLHARLVGDDQHRQYIGTSPIILEPTPPGAVDLVARRAELQARRLDRTMQPRACAEFCPAGDGPATLLVGFDHMICDASARTTLLRDLNALIATGDPAPPDIEPSTVEQYCLEQERHIARANLRNRECANWTRTLDGCVPLAGLSDRSNPAPWQAVSRQREWPGGLPHQAVSQLAAALGCTPFVIVSAALAIALWRATSVPTGAFITPISTRRTPRVAALVSNLVNERPVPYRVDPDALFAALAHELGRNCLRAVRNSWLAIPDLVEDVPAMRALFHAPAAEYLQLQVNLGDPRPDPIAPPTSVPMGHYAPGRDVTCTVIRVFLAPDRTRANVFYGGPVNGGQWAFDLTADIVATLSLLAQNSDLAIGHLADRTTAPDGGVRVP